MATPEFYRLKVAPTPIHAGNVALEAHGRVYKVLDSVIDDKNTPDVAKRDLEAIRETFSARAEARLDQVLG